MAQYTLRVFYGEELIERYEHRTPAKLRSILSHSKYNCAGQHGPFGEELKNPDSFEIVDNAREKLHHGNLQETLRFISGLR
jgi:hypothetical protein